jgi:hypothetical protein
MTFATSSSLHVRVRARRGSSRRRGGILRAFGAGVAALLIAFVSITATVMGMGRLLAFTLDTRSSVRSVFGPPADQRASAARTNIGIARQLAIVASLSPPPTTRLADVSEANVKFALAGVDPLTDPDITGSLGSAAPKLASLDISSIGRPESASARLDADRLPLPRTRPQFAALPPAANPGIEPADDPAARRTAIYDITAQIVYMPNGERLEAHSGLGGFMDNPRSVRVKDRGATPPNTYKLTLRESLFHGVQAIRMTPATQSSMFGRDGILAHSYMLGPNGQSNGCVSFKDYPRFLRAFLRGEVDRMTVVLRLDTPPRSFARSGNVSKAL